MLAEWRHDNAQEKIQSVYSTHREKRNAQQKEKFLSPDFKELIIDPFLLRLEDRTIVPGFEDTRHCLVFWARPPDHIVRLATHVQQLLKECAPSTSGRVSLSRDRCAWADGNLLQTSGSCRRTACT